MSTRLPRQHENRIPLANELHARPFPELRAPCRAVQVAFKQPQQAAERDPALDRAHLVDLIDRFGAAHPAPGADHWMGPVGRGMLKWERHTEFVTYTLFLDGAGEKPFDGAPLSLLPRDWLEAAPGVVVSASLVEVAAAPDIAAAAQILPERFGDHFVRESFAAARILGDDAAAGSDFRVHEDGLTRIAVVAPEGLGPRRLGRAVQRLLEVETYKSVSMLTLPVARRVSRRLAEIDRELTALAQHLAADDQAGREVLAQLTDLSAEIERMSAEAAFRFGAARAYAAIVDERIAVLREARLNGRQTMGEFMLRRYKPAMRTCEAAERRLSDLSDRAARIANLLRTRVEVDIAQQNQALLESMDKRAETQLRLQETVEGLSIVAISYYAVSLCAYTLGPLGKSVGLDKAYVTALLVPPVVICVGIFLRRMKKKLGH
ncbi:DUF3422 family protein [Rhodovulum sp. DZ06]|uniref:DUF3422 family protein n=1 Tax=Rhodovulum sp. DZ06 TaxID=3425126 RepID=UPI003D3363A7